MLDDTRLIEHVKADIDRLTWAASLRCVPRFRYQKYWDAENAAEDERLAVCGSFRLENVAEHSWHLCDSITVVGPRFPHLDLGRCLVLATLHDVLEIVTGDLDPIGSLDGNDTHAFCSERSKLKDEVELAAIAELKREFASFSDFQVDAILEYIRGLTPEARFVKAMDKIQSLIIILAMRSDSGLASDHVHFTERYCGSKVSSNFPELMPYFSYLMRLIRMGSEDSSKRMEDYNDGLFSLPERVNWCYCLLPRSRK